MQEQISGSSGNGCANFTVGQIDLCLFNRGPIAFQRSPYRVDGCGIRRSRVLRNFSSCPYLVFLLPGRDPFLRQLLKSGRVGLSVLELRLAPRERRLGNFQLSLILGNGSIRLPERFAKRSRIDLEEQITLIDGCSLGKSHTHQRAGNLSLHLDCRESFNRANRAYLDRNRVFSCFRYGDGDRRKSRTIRLCLRGRATAGNRNSERGNRRDNETPTHEGSLTEIVKV